MFLRSRGAEPTDTTHEMFIRAFGTLDGFEPERWAQLVDLGYERALRREARSESDPFTISGGSSLLPQEAQFIARRLKVTGRGTHPLTHHGA